MLRYGYGYYCLVATAAAIFKKTILKLLDKKNEVRNKCTCVLHMFSACLVTAKNNDAMHYIRTVLHVIKLSIALASKNKFSFI